MANYPQTTGRTSHLHDEVFEGELMWTYRDYLEHFAHTYVVTLRRLNIEDTISQLEDDISTMMVRQYWDLGQL